VPGRPASDLVFVERCEFLAGLQAFLDFPALPGYARLASGTGRGLPGADVAADQQPMASGALVDGGVGGVDQRPLVQTLALGARTSGQPLPAARWQADGQVDSPPDPDPGGDSVVLHPGKDVPDPTADQVGAQPGVIAVDLVSGRPCRASNAAVITVPASAGLV